ncbi:hypothetical protein QCA50_012786 [Cerrena zonata]|uniref:chitinase n=1 Tax=Cerrena zonata TaxID=2478898 RepID=A0AAW0FVG9_9APHY
MISKILYSLVSLGLLNSFVAAFDASANNNVAVYWGQNSGGDQTRLSDYCTSDSVDIVLLSFLSGYPDTTINFSNQCWTETCPDIGADIKTCQDNGKAVLLSMGGAAGSYGFSSDSEASAYATTLWNTFGAGSDDSVTRPFGDAVVDGFDFDPENHDQTGYVALANGLRSKFAQDSSKSYYLSASPQCVYPDANVGDLLSQVDLDFAFIQFYNNYCGVSGNSFNLDTWVDFAASAPNKNIKLFTGLAGSETSGMGFTDASNVAKQIKDFQCESNFGGAAIWDASAAFANNNYQDQIKEILDDASCTTSTSSSATATSTSSTSTTSAAVATNVASASAVTSAPVVATGHVGYSNLTINTVTDVHTTLVTITSCADNKCNEKVITTTVCDLSNSSEATKPAEVTNAKQVTTEAEQDSTITRTENVIITITSCSDNKCSIATSTLEEGAHTLAATYYNSTNVTSTSLAAESSVPTFSGYEGAANANVIGFGGLFLCLVAALI